jgi:hypothetical protein
MNIQTEYSGDYYIAKLDEPNWYVGFDAWGGDWYPDIDIWCIQTFGKSDLWGEEPQTGWKRMRNKYCFTDKAKRELFILRWA